MENKTITISYEEFKTVAIEAIADMADATGNHMLGIAATVLCVDIADRLFKEEELTIDEKDGE